VVIIGAGATGVELSAELHRTVRQVVAYGLDRIDPDKDIRLNLIEAADRVLPACRNDCRRLPRACCASSACGHTKAKVAEVLPEGVRLADGRIIAAELVVWAAGVKAPEFLKDLAAWRATASTSCWSARRCRPRATRTSSRSATAPPAPGLKEAARCRREHRRRISRLRNLFAEIPRRLAGKPPREYRYRDFVRLSRWASSARWAT